MDCEDKTARPRCLARIDPAPEVLRGRGRYAKGNA